MENVISMAEQIEIPKIISDMSADESAKLTEILKTMTMFQQEQQPRELTGDQIRQKSIEWLEQQKVQPEKFGLLDLLKNGNNRKIKRQQEKIKDFTVRKENLEGEVKRLMQGAENIQKRIAKYELKIQREGINDNFLKSISPVLPLKNSKLEKTQKRLESLAERLNYKLIKADLKKEKIELLNNKSEKCRDKINSLNDKNRAIAEIKSHGTPNAVLSYFLAEKSGISVPELTSAVNQPEDYFTPFEMNNGNPIEISDIFKNQNISTKNEYKSENVLGGVRKHAMSR